MAESVALSASAVSIPTAAAVVVLAGVLATNLWTLAGRGRERRAAGRKWDRRDHLACSTPERFAPKQGRRRADGIYNVWLGCVLHSTTIVRIVGR
jgi:hypothetical protein